MLNDALSCKKRNQYTSVDLMLQDLEAYLDGRPVAARDDTLDPWHLGLATRTARLRTMEIGLLCLSNLLVGLCVGLQSAAVAWLPEYTAVLLVGFAALALLPVIYTLARGSRPGDPNTRSSRSPTLHR